MYNSILYIGNVGNTSNNIIPNQPYRRGCISASVITNNNINNDRNSKLYYITYKYYFHHLPNSSREMSDGRVTISKLN